MQLTQERDKILLCEDLVPLFLFVNLTPIVCESRTVTTLIGACLLRVVWRYTVFEAVGTVESMYWSYPVSWILTFLIHLIYLERDRRRLMAENTAAR